MYDNDLLADPERTTLPDPLELLAALGSQRARARLPAMPPGAERHAGVVD